MKKSTIFRFVTTFVIVMVIAFIFPSTAEAEDEYEYFTFQVSGNEATLQFYHSNKTDVIIPDMYENQYPVTCIGDNAFNECENIKSVTIPSTVTTIGEDAFFDCSSLNRIVIPDSVTTIGGMAFGSCEALESIVIPDSVTSFGDDGIFFDCKSLKNVSLPEGIAVLRGTFAYCESLTNVTLPDSATALMGTFNYCSSLESIIIPDQVTTIGANAFMYCYSLSSVTIPDKVYIIGDDAFACCNLLKEVVIPQSVQFIGDRAFYYCTNFKSITIPDSVTSIGRAAFYGCSSLTRVIFQGDMPYFENDSIFTGTSPGFKVYYPVKYEENWSHYYDISQAYCNASIYPNNGSASSEVMTDVNNGHIAAPETPDYENHTFAGWFKDAACTKPWKFNTDTVSSDVSLYAKWESEAAETPELTSAASAGYNSIKLKWSAVAGADGYEIWRSSTIGGKYSKIKSVVDATTYTNTGLTTNKTYYYKVRAYFTAGTTTTYGSFSAAEYAKPVPSVPSGVKAAKVSSTSIKVSWAKVDGASKYEVYRTTSETGEYTLITTTSSLSYLNSKLIAGKTYYYKVRTYRLVGGNKVYGKYSAVVSAKP